MVIVCKPVYCISYQCRHLTVIKAPFCLAGFFPEVTFSPTRPGEGFDKAVERATTPDIEDKKDAVWVTRLKHWQHLTASICILKLAQSVQAAAYVEAGADMIFPEGLQSEDWILKRNTVGSTNVINWYKEDKDGKYVPLQLQHSLPKNFDVARKTFGSLPRPWENCLKPRQVEWHFVGKITSSLWQFKSFCTFEVFCSASEFV